MSRLARKMTTTAMAVGFAIRRTWQPANMADETRTATPHPLWSFTEPREKSRLSDIVEVLYIIYNVYILNTTCDTCRWTRLDNGRGGG
jgi:hypothetical protein